MSSERTIAERLGGPWAISWLACAINAALASAIFLAEGLSGSTTGLGPWLALIMAALVPPVAAVAILDNTVLRNRRTSPVSPVLVVVINGFLGGLFNAGIWLGSSITGISTASASMSSVVTVVIMSMWWGSALTIFLDYRDESRSTRASLIEDAVRVELAELQQDEILLGMQLELAAEIDVELLPLKQELLELRATGHGPDAMSVLAERMRATAQDSVRPLSRELWQQATLHYPPTQWWRIAASVPKYQPFRAVLLAGVHMTLTTGPSIQAFGIARGLTLVLAESLVIIVIASFFNVLMQRLPRHHVALFIAGTVVLQASIPVRAIVREHWQPGTATAGWQVTQVLVGVAIIWVTSGISSWVEATGQIRSEFRAELDEATITSIARSRQMSDLARAAARKLHGTVQSRLVACAIEIDQASSLRDTARINAALNAALDALDTPLDFESQPATIRDEVLRKAAAWQGICVVDVDVASDIAEWQEPAARVGLIVEEGLANAVRRGDASWVGIAVQAAFARQVLVVIEDDGTGPGTGQPGMGSAIINQAAAGDWRLEATARGARLTAVVPWIAT